MKKGKCEKGFPKEFRETTCEDAKGFPQYRRRCKGVFTKKVKGGDVLVDNRWVVPYSPNLLADQDSHVNVEVSALLENVKYLHKYLVKMPDRAEVVMQLLDGQDVDEITMFMEHAFSGPNFVHTAQSPILKKF